MIIRIESAVQGSVRTHLPAGAAMYMVAEHLSDLVASADTYLTRERYTDENFTKRDGYCVRGQQTTTEALLRVSKELESFFNRFPDQSELVNAFSAVLKAASNSSAGLRVVGESYRSALVRYLERFETESLDSLAHVSITDDGLIVSIDTSSTSIGHGDESF